MPNSISTLSSQTPKERSPIPSHPYCPLISANCDRVLIQNCGEQNAKRLPMLPTEICPHALKALLSYATNSLGLNRNEVSMSGHGDTATISIIKGTQIASVTRGTMTTASQVVN